MAEELAINKSEIRAERYKTLLSQIEALIGEEKNLVANMANISAALKQTFDFLWVGFYLVDTIDELVLGPFQGPIACTRIKKGRGVCGVCWNEEKTQLVANVDEFPGHIACSSDSKSEVVIPVYDTNNHIFAVLDVDSNMLNDFSNIDVQYLEKICSILAEKSSL